MATPQIEVCLYLFIYFGPYGFMNSLIFELKMISILIDIISKVPDHKLKEQYF